MKYVYRMNECIRKFFPQKLVGDKQVSFPTREGLWGKNNSAFFSPPAQRCWPVSPWKGDAEDARLEHQQSFTTQIQTTNENRSLRRGVRARGWKLI